ncbi:MAG: hypothetical protein ACXABX_06525 [Candidatus Thorarchaeota archaeon]|jgi:hypothetical protein
MSEDSQSQQIDRIFTFDFVRGSAIIGILILHRILWDWFFQTFDGSTELPPEIGILYIFITMAGIFYVISGAVYSFMIHKRLSNGRITEKQVILGGWVTGLLLIIYSSIMRIFLIRFIDDTMPLVQLDPTLDNGTGILSYLILHGRLPDPLVLPGQFIGIETLAMIGFTIIFVSTFLGLLYRWKGLENPQFIYLLLAITGAMVLIVSPILRFTIGAVADLAFQNGDYLVAFFTYPLTNGMMPLFPHLSYGCFGAILGLAIARRESSKKVLLSVITVAVILLIVGTMFSGDYQGLPGQEPFDWLSNVELIARKFVQLGFFFSLFFLGLLLVDYRSNKTRQTAVRITSPIMLFGKLALTVYMLEGLMAVTIQRVVSPLWLAWNATFLNIIVFGVLNVFVWYVILRIWKRYEFKGSLEWALAWLVKKLSGKKSSRFRE